jgi:hypothetical protein
VGLRPSEFGTRRQLPRVRLFSLCANA